MIFVTVGTQLPFVRLVSSMDIWAGQHPEQEVIVQSGAMDFQLKHCQSRAFIGPEEWERLFGEAEIVVSHAGMGTILKSVDAGKPLIIMPRQAILGEHRNDHQVATAERFLGFGNIAVVNNESELLDALQHPPKGGSQGAGGSSGNLERLTGELRRFVRAE